jgi:hypothetical protein
MRVTLDWYEVSRAAQVGVSRQVHNLVQGNHDAHRFDGEPWGTHIAGALAELAYAKATNTYWLPLAKDPKTLPGDVGLDQVRSTDRPQGCLLLHPDDADHARFFLVVGKVPTYEVVGWCFGYEGKDEKYWRTGTGRPCYFVPQSSLRPLEVAAVAA